MEYGRFHGEGSQYAIRTPKTPNTWFNYLFNDSYYMEIAQTAQGNSQCLDKGMRTFTRGYRYFYLYNHTTEKCWNPNYKPLKANPDHFVCTHALGWTEIESAYEGITASIKAFVPTEGVQEVWILKLKNINQEIQEVSLYSVFSFEKGDPMGSKCNYDEEKEILWSFTYPYHVYYEDKEKLDDKNSLIYMFANQKITSFDCSEKRFFGGDDITEMPAAILKGGCSNTLSEWDRPVGAFEHRYVLQPGEEQEICMVIGCAKDLEEASKAREKFLTEGAIEKELQKVEDYWSKISGSFEIQTPDQDLNFFTNYWLKKQVTLMAKNNRLSVYCPVRNQLQDAMGYSMIDPTAAEELMIKVMKRQEENGFIQQWYMTDGSSPKALCLLKHKDAPIWLVSCMCALIHQAGNLDLLDRKVEFVNTSKLATIYEHLLRALYYLAGETGEHGLCLMGDGDWTDPINGAGRLGRGESTWSTMGLKYAILEFLPFVERKNDRIHMEKLQAIAEALDKAINAYCWDGDWYVAGYDDFGIPFGRKEDVEGKIFLNAQTWAIMSQTARGDRLTKCKKSIEALDTPCGPSLLSPAFSGWNKTWGRISVKLGGTTENGSVYCHASMFKAYADCISRDGNKAYETIRRTLPTNINNGPDKNMQVPLFVPNFYFGLQDSPNFGQSSNHHSTGTAAWMLWVTMDHMLGIKSTVDGIEICPCIPSHWRKYMVKKVFRTATYFIEVMNPTEVQTGIKEIYVDGQRMEGVYLPYEENRQYRVEVIMGE